MDETPAWLESLAEAVGGSMTAHGPIGPLGLRYRQVEGTWDALVYPLPVEMVGGAHDGGVACPSFALDLETLRAHFDRVESLGWDPHGIEAEGGEPCVAVRGAYAGQSVWLRILAYAPEDVAPGAKVDANGRQAG